MRISDWSSDVCSSDLPWKRDVGLVGIIECPHRSPRRIIAGELVAEAQTIERQPLIDYARLGVARALVLPAQCDQLVMRVVPGDRGHVGALGALQLQVIEIGRASCRERVCQYV